MSCRKWNGLPVVIFGTSGAAKEAKFLLDDINRNASNMYNFVGYVSNKYESGAENIIQEEDFEKFASKFKILGVILPFGDPKIKRKIYEGTLVKLDNIVFPNIMHPRAIISPTLKLGYGNIICANVIIDPDVRLGNFVFINILSTIGHDSIIEDFTTINISVNISGNCHVKENTLIGTNCSVKQGIVIGANSICGMGAIVVDAVEGEATVISPKAVKTKTL